MSDCQLDPDTKIDIDDSMAGKRVLVGAIASYIVWQPVRPGPEIGLS